MVSLTCGILKEKVKTHKYSREMVAGAAGGRTRAWSAKCANFQL